MSKLEGVTLSAPLFNRRGSRGSDRGSDLPKFAEQGSGTTRARRAGMLAVSPHTVLQAFGLTRSGPDQGDEPSLHDCRCGAGPAQGQVIGGSQTRCRITPPL